MDEIKLIKTLEDAGCDEAANLLKSGESKESMDDLDYLPNGQWILEKAAIKKPQQAVWSMDHISQVANAKDHNHAKSIAHDAINSSTAHKYNKSKLAHAVNTSRNVKHLASVMVNHHLAHENTVRQRAKGRKDSEWR